MHDSKDKVIVITGAADGIGFAIARQFLQNAAKTVFILDIDDINGIKSEKELNTYGGGQAIFIQCDVTKDLEKVAKKIFNLTKVDVLVYCAGVLDEWSPRKVMNINAVSLVEFAMKFWEHMRVDRGGHGGTIMNMGSVCSYFKDDPYLAIYKASKFAVMGFTKAIGNECNFKKFGVRVLILCPAMTSTKMTAKQMTWDEHVGDFEEYIKDMPWQMPDDVGKAALEVFAKAESGTAWSIIGGEVAEV